MALAHQDSGEKSGRPAKFNSTPHFFECMVRRMSISNEAIVLTGLCEGLARLERESKNMVQKYGAMTAGIAIAKELRRIGFDEPFWTGDKAEIKELATKLTLALQDLNESVVCLSTFLDENPNYFETDKNDLQKAVADVLNSQAIQVEFQAIRDAISKIKWPG